MLVQFGNNWIQKIPLTAKLDSAYGFVQFWLSSEFFSSNYFQIGQHVLLLHYTNSRSHFCAGVILFATPYRRAPKVAKQLSTVATLLYRFLSCWCLAKSTFYVVYQPCSFACILIIHGRAEILN